MKQLPEHKLDQEQVLRITNLKLCRQLEKMSMSNNQVPQIESANNLRA